MSGDWMKEFKRSASEKIKSPNISTATENLTRSIKESFRTGFLNRDVHSESLDSETKHQEHLLKPLKSVNTVSASNVHETSPTVIGHSPVPHSPFQPRQSRFPLDQNHPLHPGPLNKSIGNFDSNSHVNSPLKKRLPSITSSDRDSDSPSSKLPPSPVLRTLRSTREESDNSKTGSLDSPFMGKKKVVKKRSNLLDSSSSEEEENTDQKCREFIRKKSSSTEDSSPSPRTPNSFKILSGIERNQATAFDFPPSPFVSRPSSYERHSERQSSDDFSTTISSFRSRSTSSDVFDDASSCTNLAPIPLPKKKASPLRKQQAVITEELSPPHNKVWSDAQIENDSGLSDGTFPLTPPRSYRSTKESTSSVEDTATGNKNEPQEGPSPIFRKVTIRKRQQTRSPSPRTEPEHPDLEPRPSSEPLHSTGNQDEILMSKREKDECGHSSLRLSCSPILPSSTNHPSPIRLSSSFPLESSNPQRTKITLKETKSKRFFMKGGWSYANEQVGIKMKSLRKSRIPFTFKSRNSFSPNTQIMTLPLSNSSRQNPLRRKGRNGRIGHVPGILTYLQPGHDPQSRASVSSQIPLFTTPSVHLLSVTPRSDSRITNHDLVQNISSLTAKHAPSDSTLRIDGRENVRNYSEKMHDYIGRCHIPCISLSSHQESDVMRVKGKTDIVSGKRASSPELGNANSRKRYKNNMKVNQGKNVSSSLRFRDGVIRATQNKSNEGIRDTCPYYYSQEKKKERKIQDTNMISCIPSSIDPKCERIPVTSLEEETKSKEKDRQNKYYLKVRSHLKVSDGTAYIEDSDWEMSDSDPDPYTFVRTSGCLISSSFKCTQKCTCAIYPLNMSPGFTRQVLSKKEIPEKSIIRVVNTLLRERKGFEGNIVTGNGFKDVNNKKKRREKSNVFDGKKKVEKENDGNYELNRNHNDSSRSIQNSYDCDQKEESKEDEKESRQLLKWNGDPPFLLPNCCDLALKSKCVKPEASNNDEKIEKTTSKDSEENGIAVHHSDSREEDGNVSFPLKLSLPFTRFMINHEKNQMNETNMESNLDEGNDLYWISLKNEEIDTMTRGKGEWNLMNFIFMRSELFFPPFTFTQDYEFVEEEIGTKIQSFQQQKQPEKEDFHQKKNNCEVSRLYKSSASTSTTSISLDEKKKCEQRGTNYERESSDTKLPTFQIEDFHSRNDKNEEDEDVARESDMVKGSTGQNDSSLITRILSTSMVNDTSSTNTMESSKCLPILRSTFEKDQKEIMALDWEPSRQISNDGKIERDHEEDYETDNNQEYLEYDFNCFYPRSLNQQSSSQQKTKETHFPAGSFMDTRNNRYQQLHNNFCNDHDMTPNDVSSQNLNWSEVTISENNSKWSQSTPLITANSSSEEINNEAILEHSSFNFPSFGQQYNEKHQIVTQFKHTNYPHVPPIAKELPYNTISTISPFTQRMNKSNGECNKLAQSSCSSSHDQVTQSVKKEKVGEEKKGERIGIEFAMSRDESWGGSGIFLGKNQTDDHSFAQPLKSIRRISVSKNPFHVPGNEKSEMNYETDCESTENKKEEKKEDKRAPSPPPPSPSSSLLLTCSASSRSDCFTSTHQQQHQEQQLQVNNSNQPTSVISHINIHIVPSKWPLATSHPSVSIHQQQPASRTKDNMKNDVKMFKNEYQQESKIPNPPTQCKRDNLPQRSTSTDVPDETVYQVTRISIDGSSPTLDDSEKIRKFNVSSSSLKPRCGVKSNYVSDANVPTVLDPQSNEVKQPVGVQVLKHPVSGIYTSSVTSFITQRSSFHQDVEQTKDNSCLNHICDESHAISNSCFNEEKRHGGNQNIHSNFVNVSNKREKETSSSNPHCLYSNALRGNDESVKEEELNNKMISNVTQEKNEKEEKLKDYNERGVKEGKLESEFLENPTSFHSKSVTGIDDDNCQGKVVKNLNQGVVCKVLSLPGLTETNSGIITTSSPSLTTTVTRGSCGIKTCHELNNRRITAAAVTPVIQQQEIASNISAVVVAAASPATSFGNKLHSTQLFLNPKAATATEFSLNEVTDHGFGSLKSCRCSSRSCSHSMYESVVSHSQVSNTDETSNIPSLCHRNLSCFTDSLPQQKQKQLAIETPPAFPAKQFIRSSSFSPHPAQYSCHSSPSLDQPQYNNSTTITPTNLLTIQSPGDLPTSSPTVKNDHNQTSRNENPTSALLNHSHDHLDPSQSQFSSSPFSRKDFSRSADLKDLSEDDVPVDSSISLEHYYEQSLSSDHEITNNVSEVLTPSLRKPSQVVNQGKSGKDCFQKPLSLEEQSLHDSSYQLEDAIHYDSYIESDIEAVVDFSDDEFREDGSQSVRNYNFMNADPQLAMYSNFGNPISYPLHTIAEESCEESDRETTPVNSIEFRVKSNHNEQPYSRPDSYDPSYYQPRSVGIINDFSRHMTRNSNQDDNRSESETEKSDGSAEEEECDVLSDIEVDPSSSRLEQYFMSGLLDSAPNDGPSSIREKPSLYHHHSSPHEEEQHEPNKVKSFIQKIQPSSPVSSSSSKSHSSHERREESERREKLEDDKVNVVSDDEKKLLNRSVTKITISHEADSLPTESCVDDSNYDCDEDAESNLIKRSPAKNVTAIVNNENTNPETQSETELVKLMTKFLAQLSDFKQKEYDSKNTTKSSSTSSLTPCTTRNSINPCGSLKSDSNESILKDLELQLSLLMKNNVSQTGGANTAVTSPGGTASAIGSNNSDYGSDTLESGDCSSEDDAAPRRKKVEGCGKEEGRRGSSSKKNNVGIKSDEGKEQGLFLLFQKILETASSSLSDLHENSPSSLEVISSKSEKEKNLLAHQIVSLMHSTSFLNSTLVTESFHSEHDEKNETSFQLKLKNGKQSSSIHLDQTDEQLIHSNSRVSMSPSSHPSSSNSLDHSTRKDHHSLLVPKSSLNSDSGSEATMSASVSIPELGEEREDVEGDESDHDHINEIEILQVSREMEHLFPITKSDEGDAANCDSSFEKEVKETLSTKLKFDSDSDAMRHNLQSDNADLGHSIESFETVREGGINYESTRIKSVTPSSNILNRKEHVKISIDEKAGHLSDSIDENDRASNEKNLSEELTNHNLYGKNKTTEKKIPSDHKSCQDKQLNEGLKGEHSKKSAGNIAVTLDPKQYYSFKSSQESVKSVQEIEVRKNSNEPIPFSSRQSSTLPSPKKKRAPMSPSLITEEGEGGEKYIKIPRKYISTHPSNKEKNESQITATSSSSSFSQSTTDPSKQQSSIRTPSSSATHSSRPSFLTTSGVMKKLAAFRDEGLTRASPRILKGKLANAFKERGSNNSGQLPQISVSDYSGSLSFKSMGSSDTSVPKDTDYDTEEGKVTTFKSQTSLSSLGIRSDSMSSICSGSGYRYGLISVTGEVLFGLSYNYRAGSMDIHIKECRNLAAVDSKRMRSDPYVKVYLLPDRSKNGKRKTKVKKNSLNPSFDETLKYSMTVSEVTGRTLWLSIWHSDIFGRNDFLGEVTLPLGHGIFETPGLKWYPLQDRIDSADHASNYRGEIFIAMKFVSLDSAIRGSVSSMTRGHLHVMVKEAHNLSPSRGSNASPFCKSYFLPERSKSAKQKTGIAKKTTEPKWNHTFIYEDLSLSDLKARCLELTIWDYDKLGSNEFLGGIRLSRGPGNILGII